MHFVRLPLVLLLCMAPLQATAEVNCAFFNSIERIQFAQLRLASAGDSLFSSRDAALFVSEMSRLDSAQIKIAHDGQLSPLDIATIAAFLSYAEQLAIILMRHDRQMARNYFARPSFAPQQASIARILPRLKCNDQTASGTANDTQRVTSSIKQELGARKITFVGTATVLASVVFLIALGHRIYVLGTAWRHRKKRRSKRFHCHIETQVNYGEKSKRGAILDLSCNGAKIQIDLASDETSVEIWLINRWHKGNVSWCNPHYIGIKFGTPLKRAFVESICTPLK